MMETLEVSAKQFRAKQGSFFDMADRGRQIVITRGVRGVKQSYMLTSVEDDGFKVTPELLEKLDNIRQSVKNGEYTECSTIDEALKHLEAL